VRQLRELLATRLASRGEAAQLNLQQLGGRREAVVPRLRPRCARPRALHPLARDRQAQAGGYKQDPLLQDPAPASTAEPRRRQHMPTSSAALRALEQARSARLRIAGAVDGDRFRQLLDTIVRAAATALESTPGTRGGAREVCRGRAQGLDAHDASADRLLKVCPPPRKAYRVWRVSTGGTTASGRAPFRDAGSLVIARITQGVAVVCTACGRGSPRRHQLPEIFSC
jgi:hypothetical protein